MKRSVIAVLVLTSVVTAGCGSSTQTAAPPQTTPADLPAVTAVAADSTTIPVGSWGVVRARQSPTGGTDIFAIKVVSVVAGKAGDFGDVSSLNGAGSVDAKTGVPYFVAYDYAALVGNAMDAPNQQVFLAVGDNTDSVDSMLVPQDHENCSPAETQIYPSTFGVQRVGCAVGIAAASTVPTTLVYSASGGSTDVQFALPKH